MKVLYYGNQGNTGYEFTRWLNQSGIETTLVYDKNNIGERSHPSWELNQSKIPYQEKIHTYAGTVYNRFFPPKKVKKLSESVDLIIATGLEIVPALFLHKPLVVRGTGGDVTSLPFMSNNLKNEFRSWIYRAYSKNIDCITAVQENIYWAAKLLEIKQIQRLPIPVDIDWIHDNIDFRLKNKLNKKYRKQRILFFCPSRKNIVPHERAYKGAEKVIFAFEDFLKKTPNPNSAKLIASLHGHHITKYKKLLNNSNINPSNVDFIGHLQRPQLHAYMSLDKTIVLDNFKKKDIGGNKFGTLSGCVREATALGTPLISSLDPNSTHFVRLFGNGCPLYVAESSNEIYKAMNYFSDLNTKTFDQLKTELKTWALNTIDWKKILPKYINIFRDIITKG